MTLKLKTREEEEQLRLLHDYIYDEENRIRHQCAVEGLYRGDLVHTALVKVMSTALGLGLSLGRGRVRYRPVVVRTPELPRTA
jgi:hypothetical protein